MSLSKLKTLEYRLFKKMREMLTIYYKNESQRLKQLKILEKQKNYKKDNKQ